VALGEIHHAVAEGALDAARVRELGDVLLGRSPGRRREDEITVCDLTGVGVQDAAIAAVALAGARGIPNREIRG
jgi:ornithine cyclodeaminase